MGMHESAVNYQNLIRDLAEMYPFEVAEVVLVELVANSLDAKASRISIECDFHGKVLIIEDNGLGMDASQFSQYHDFAAGLKTRGSGIGFAGVGAKISFNVADRVITETRSKTFSGGSDWYLQSSRKFLWEDIKPRHLRGTGTRVEVRFRRDAKLPYASSDDIIKLLRRHYLPVLDSKFLSLYERMKYYSGSLNFIVNGRGIKPGDVVTDYALDKVREFFPTAAGKRIGYGLFGLAPSPYPLAADICGVLLCTRGKVIKAELFNQFPGDIGPRVFGLVEIPDFVNFLTTSKTDFTHARRYREFEKLYDPIRQEFKDWLGELGIQSPEMADSDEAVRLERELKRMLDEVPELSDFFGFRARKPVLAASETGPITGTPSEGIDLTFPTGKGEGGVGPGVVDVGPSPGTALSPEVRREKTEPAKPISRVARRGPKIAFVSAPERLDLAWVDGNNIVVNSGHPCYAKTPSNNLARRLHNLFAIASAVQRFLAGGGQPSDSMFIDRMMAAWGRK